MRERPRRALFSLRNEIALSRDEDHQALDNESTKVISNEQLEGKPSGRSPRSKPEPASSGGDEVVHGLENRSNISIHQFA